MQSKPSGNLKQQLTKAALLVVLAPISLAIFFVASNAVYQIEQTQLVKRNFTKIKIGMSSTEVESLLGWPDVRYCNVRDKFNLLPRSMFLSRLRFNLLYSDEMTDYKGVPINTPGKEVWIYQDIAPSFLGPGSPAIVFDIKTGKVVQLNRVFNQD